MNSPHSHTAAKTRYLHSNDKRYSIEPGWTPGRVWVYHKSGEGAEFDFDKVETAIKAERLHEFYGENF